MEHCRRLLFIAFLIVLTSLFSVSSSPAQTCTDSDTDGYGVGADLSGCSASTLLPDCDDSDPLVHPGALEICDGKDTNCDGYQTFVDKDKDGDGVAWCAGDCDDNDPARKPGADELCDGIDNDCNGIPGAFERDSDGDGYRLCDVVPDCNDFDPLVSPGAPEICSDSKDNDCDGIIDEPEPDCVCPDADGDGQTNSVCGGTDCNDNDPQIFPGAVKLCTDGIDNDCDGLVDIKDPDAINCPVCVDGDGDGYYINGGACGPVDCDDTDINVHPGAPEICDGKDSNCDGYQSFIDRDKDSDGVAWCAGDCDDNDPSKKPGTPELCNGIDDDCNGILGALEHDSDKDGYRLCDTPADCNDFNASIHPGASEICSDKIDNNCNSTIDEAGCVCPDTDKDGQTSAVCGGTDCNDADPTIYVGAPEICNDGKDNNCNSAIDCADAACSTDPFCLACALSDLDGDGYATIGGICGPVDCDDADIRVHPGAAEICDGKDSNCDGIKSKTDVDMDGDGIAWCAGDCDDNNSNRYPGAPELCNGVDDDCNGMLRADERDSDGDAFRLCDPFPDCDDFDPMTYPGAPEICSDKKDNNCNGEKDEAGCICPDADGDGQTWSVCGGTDCNDSDPSAYLGAVEICTDGIDNDCDGLVDIKDPDAINCPVCTDFDGDGYYVEGGGCGEVDCDDADPNVYPGAPEICDGKDSNCDGSRSFVDVDKDGDGVAWCAGDCDDNNPSSYPGGKEGPSGTATCADGVDNNCNGKIDAADGGCAPPTCETRISPKSGQHMETLLNPDNTVHPDNSYLLCAKCHYENETGARIPEGPLHCQRCHADPSDTSDPLNGVMKLQYPLPWPYGFGSAPNVKTHSHLTVGDKYGTWDIHCITCHSPHLQEQDLRYGTSYGQLIRELVCYDNQATNQSIESLVFFTSPVNAGSFADGPPHNENICEICHTRTDHHWNNGMAPADLDPGGVYKGHFDGQDCMECHPHSGGFKPACGSCHDVPPPTGTHLKHFGGTKDDAVYGSTSIAQDVTSDSPVYIMNCGNCHPLDVSRHMNSINNSGGGTAEIELFNVSSPDGSLKSKNLPTATYSPGPTLFTDNKGMQYTQGTCSGVYCHSGLAVQTTQEIPLPVPDPVTFYPLVYNPDWQGLVIKSRNYEAPVWGVDSLGCDGCHGYPITGKCIPEFDVFTGEFISCTGVSAGAGDSHAWIDQDGLIALHAKNRGYDPLQCNTCHYATVQADAPWIRDPYSIWFGNVPIANHTRHVNGIKDVAFTPIPVEYFSFFNPVFHDLSSASYDPSTSTCSNVSCHYFQTEVTWGMPYRENIFPECNRCHLF